MGSSSSKPVVSAPAAIPAPDHSPPPAASKGEGGCPVKHGKKSSPEGCPVKHGKGGTVYNVYSQPIDTSNQMPSNPNQLPAPQQTESLSVNRVPSNIPKGNTSDQTWTYPSPQMFYNALVRKGKLGDTKEEDVESVVALHNNMNERTWRQVVAWERLAGEDDPKLLKFIGKPSDLSPKARLKHWLFFHPLPFDRHDWTVQRADGTTVRYLIDYYHDESQSSTEEGSGMPSLTDRIPSLLVDVRPALDSPQDLYQRAVIMPSALSSGKTDFESLPLAPSDSLGTMLVDSMHVWDSIQRNKLEEDQQRHESESNISKKEATALAKTLHDSADKCRTSQQRMSKCISDKECQEASLDLTRCLGKLWCPLQHDALMEALAGGDADIEVALERLTGCVSSAHERAAQARKSYPSIFVNEK
jgi:cytochrome c heme-lyase